ncbi:hypothetical protein [Streptomyces daliensis]
MVVQQEDADDASGTVRHGKNGWPVSSVETGEGRILVRHFAHAMPPGDPSVSGVTAPDLADVPAL